MPRSGGGIYSLPPGTDMAPNTTIQSAWANALTADLEQDANTPRPVVAGGTGATTLLAAGIAELGEGNTFTADQTITSADSGATAGPILTLYRNSPSAAISDLLGRLQFDGEDGSGGFQASYASIGAQIVDPTAGSERGALNFGVVHQGSDTTAATLFSDNTVIKLSLPQTGSILSFGPTSDVVITHSTNALAFTGASSGYSFDDDITVASTDAGATADGNLILYRNSASPAANDVLNEVIGRGKDSGGNDTDYGKIQFSAKAVTGGAEEGRVRILVTDAGANQEVISLTNNAITQTTGGATQFTWNTNSDANSMRLLGGNAASGGIIDIFGSSHASSPTSIKLTGEVNIGTFDTNGASNGKLFQNSTAVLLSSRTVTTAIAHQAFNNPNGQVGTITTTGTATAYNTSSDERLKEDFAGFDAGPLLDAINIYQFQWKSDGSIGYGPKAQELYDVFPDAVSPGSTGDQPGDETFQPWGYDASKLMPLLIRELQSLRARVAALEAS